MPAGPCRRRGPLPKLSPAGSGSVCSTPPPDTACTDAIRHLRSRISPVRQAFRLRPASSEPVRGLEAHRGVRLELTSRSRSRAHCVAKGLAGLEPDHAVRRPVGVRDVPPPRPPCRNRHVPAARLIELLTEAEPHAMLGTCVPPGTLGLLVRPWGAAAASAAAWFLGCHCRFFFAPADPLTPIPSDRSSCS